MNKKLPNIIKIKNQHIQGSMKHKQKKNEKQYARVHHNQISENQ